MTNEDRVLTGLKSGKTPGNLAEELDLRRQTITAMVELLAHQGKVKEIDCSSSCESCITGNSCAGSGSGKEKLYLVEEEIEE